MLGVRGKVNIGEGPTGAIFSNSPQRHRYLLWRTWQPANPRLGFVGINPSTANSSKNDPTIRRLTSLANAWGFGGLVAANLFSLVSADPNVLWTDYEPSQDRSFHDGMNEGYIRWMVANTTKILVGWGNEGKRAGVKKGQVLNLLGQKACYIKANKSGEPIHPLYVPKTSQLIPYVSNLQ